MPSNLSVTETTSALRLRLTVLVVILVAAFVLALAWTWTPLRDWLDVDQIVAGLRAFGRSFGPVAAVAGFALALTVAIPLTFLTLVALVAFGPWGGLGCAMAGATIGAAASYGLGHVLGREALERLAGPRVNLLSRRLASRGVLAVIVIRLVPIAPFAVINMVAGASHIRLRDLLARNRHRHDAVDAGHGVFRRPDHGGDAQSDAADVCPGWSDYCADCCWRLGCAALGAQYRIGRSCAMVSLAAKPPERCAFPGLTGQPLHAAWRLCQPVPR